MYGERDLEEMEERSGVPICGACIILVLRKDGSKLLKFSLVCAGVR